MKKKTKITKTLALALTLGLLCSGLAGCGQAQSVETVSEDLATESVQPTETVESTETVAEGTEATAENTETADGTLVRVASLKGPTSLGLLFLMNKADKGETANTYEFQMATGADEILPLMVKGDLDIALVPANVASVLYHKTQGGVKVIDINDFHTALCLMIENACHIGGYQCNVQISLYHQRQDLICTSSHLEFIGIGSLTLVCFIH